MFNIIELERTLIQFVIEEENKKINVILDNIHNDIAGEISLIYFQAHGMLERIATIILVFSTANITGDNDNKNINIIPGITNNAKPSCIKKVIIKSCNDNLGNKGIETLITSITFVILSL
ncbi:hypothetical protein HHS_06180 [Candidatus Pantoea carbekii]|uniref:Uncharacterized protein n=1 Tax=Candidatus Pantoea carbekii TaxID=1235990 RepID=U3U9N3_9GAMM|nr:hypothetical protein HHS_06180 [Candidatus Pantoea carbekii]